MRSGSSTALFLDCLTANVKALRCFQTKVNIYNSLSRNIPAHLQHGLLLLYNDVLRYEIDIFTLQKITEIETHKDVCNPNYSQFFMLVWVLGYQCHSVKVCKASFRKSDTALKNSVTDYETYKEVNCIAVTAFAIFRTANLLVCRTKKTAFI
jgi:hypothetical protein